jgi:hypothetical protein
MTLYAQAGLPPEQVKDLSPLAPELQLFDRGRGGAPSPGPALGREHKYPTSTD